MFECVFCEDNKTGDADTLHIFVHRKKTGENVSFYVYGSDHVRRYIKIRDETAWINRKTKSSRVFWQRREIKCKGKGTGQYRWHPQACGVHWFSKYTKELAKAIGIVASDLYTPHCVHRTGA